MEISHDPIRQRFVLALENAEAELNYRPLASEGLVAYERVFVPPAHRGRGVAEKLSAFAFDYARSAGWRVRPVCPYLANQFLRRHPDYQDVVMES